MAKLRSCDSWPDCNCYSYLALWGKNLQDEDEVWDRNDLAIAEEMIFVTLCCVEKRCPDKAVRQFMKQQLRKEFWDRQWTKFNHGNRGRKWQDNIVKFIRRGKIEKQT